MSSIIARSATEAHRQTRHFPSFVHEQLLQDFFLQLQVLMTLDKLAVSTSCHLETSFPSWKNYPHDEGSSNTTFSKHSRHKYPACKQERFVCCMMRPCRLIGIFLRSLSVLCSKRDARSLARDAVALVAYSFFTKYSRTLLPSSSRTDVISSDKVVLITFLRLVLEVFLWL